MPNWTEKMFLHPFKSYSVAAKLKLLACTLSEVGARAQLRLRGVNNMFLYPFGISGLHWKLVPHEWYGAILGFYAATVFCCEAPEVFCRLDLTFHQHAGEQLLTELSFSERTDSLK